MSARRSTRQELGGRWKVEMRPTSHLDPKTFHAFSVNSKKRGEQSVDFRRRRRSPPSCPPAPMRDSACAHESPLSPPKSRKSTMDIESIKEIESAPAPALSFLPCLSSASLFAAIRPPVQPKQRRATINYFLCNDKFEEKSDTINLVRIEGRRPGMCADCYVEVVAAHPRVGRWVGNIIRGRWRQFPANPGTHVFWIPWALGL